MTSEEFSLSGAGFGKSMLNEWALDPEVTYLNHGTVGAPPRRVLSAQQKLRDEIERQPSRFMLREISPTPVGAPRTGESRLRMAAGEVAHFLGADGKDLVFVDNTTTGINAVLRCVAFRKNDELLVFDQTYGAILNAAKYATRVHGANVRIAEFPRSIAGPEDVVQALEKALRPQTRLVLVDHITSGSALILPIAEIVSRCHQRGVFVLVDGAHAPGAIPVDIQSLGADWYAGNLHKWAWSPRSSGILWTSQAHQESLHPNVISWGLDQGLAQEFDWPGTRDPTPHLAAPAGIAYMRELGVAKVQGYNHELAWTAGREMARRWDSALLGPKTMIGTMVTVPLPEQLGSTPEHADTLRDALLFENGIEVHVKCWKGRLQVRVSAQIYNDMHDVERMIDAIDARI